MEQRIGELLDLQRAILNMVEDLEEERGGQAATQQATLNVLEDFEEEKRRIGEAQTAVLNVLEDSDAETVRLGQVQRAALNMLEDLEAEKERLEDTQTATFNVLDEMDVERSRLRELQRAALNILEDLQEEKERAESVNQKLLAQIEERERAESEIKKLSQNLRKRAAELEAANRELEAFTYSVSHDLRAPLRAMDGFAQALVEDYPEALDSVGQMYLGRIRAGSQRMGQLIDDLLQLSRLTRGELRRRPVDLSAMVSALVAELRRAEPGRRVEVAIEKKMVALADDHLLRVALENLLSNAWKFTRQTPAPRIEVGSQGKDRRIYFVKDNGAGFDMRFKDKLFGVFQRLHSAPEYPGTGVGLATVKRVIERHGGTVWAEGQVGLGATFYFTLGAGEEAER